MKKSIYYNSKVLLFGEYSVFLGGKSMATTWSKYSGTWDKFFLEEDAFYLQDFHQYIQFLADINDSFEWELNMDKLEKHIQKNLFFNSTIPAGYGLGSSAALTAGVFNSYSSVKKHDDLEDIIEQLARMEDFFHKKSSGFDPLVVFMDKTICRSGDKYKVLEKKDDPVYALKNLYLLDSNKSRSTAKYVNIFFEKLKDKKFRKIIEKEYIPLSDKAINALLDMKIGYMDDYFWELSKLQYKYFNEMIPKKIDKLWRHGLDSGEYFMKLCGAGGGGFFLIWPANKEVLTGIPNKYNIQKFL